MKEIINTQFSFQEINLYIKLFRLSKSHIFLVSEHNEMDIGSVTLASPSLIEGMIPSSTSYMLFGIKNKMITQVISEKTATTLKTPVLLLFHLISDVKEEDLIKPLMRFINDSIKDLDNKIRDAESGI
ncbi:MAG: hypothetical protein EU532_14430 [Promethearchaeota archaeon]|nr:MAG: hypothetical protein EU532_14430 [Candidatus Lokiarchaeota archaeon]